MLLCAAGDIHGAIAACSTSVNVLGGRGMLATYLAMMVPPIRGAE
jgi:hypothetical protein